MLNSLDIIIICLTVIATVLVIGISIKNYKDAQTRQKHYEAFLNRREERRQKRISGA
jgi:hypothetical protein